MVAFLPALLCQPRRDGFHLLRLARHQQQTDLTLPEQTVTVAKMKNSSEYKDVLCPVHNEFLRVFPCSSDCRRSLRTLYKREKYRDARRKINDIMPASHI